MKLSVFRVSITPLHRFVFALLLITIGCGCEVPAPSNLNKEKATNELPRGVGSSPNGSEPGTVEERLREIISKNPEAAETRLRLAQLLVRNGKLAEAIGKLRTASRIRPYNGLIHNNLAFYLLHSGDVQGAVIESQKAVDLDPTDSDFHENLGVSLDAAHEMEGGCQRISTRAGDRSGTGRLLE